MDFELNGEIVLQQLMLIFETIRGETKTKLALRRKYRVR